MDQPAAAVACSADGKRLVVGGRGGVLEVAMRWLAVRSSARRD